MAGVEVGWRSFVGMGFGETSIVAGALANEGDGQAEAQLSFWGEPFMARTAGRDVPRYIFHVHAHSELVPRLVELARTYRMAS